MKRTNLEAPQQISDIEIVGMFWQRNEVAIPLTSQKYDKLLYQIGYNILHDHCDCEECQNDTYLGIWNAIPPTRPQSFRAFIAGMMRNIAIDKYYHKASKKRIPSELTVSMDECKELLSAEGNPYDEILVKELGRIISSFIRSLDEKDKYVFMSRFYLVESVELIAGELRVTESAIYKKLTKLKADLKKYLEENGVLL